MLAQVRKGGTKQMHLWVTRNSLMPWEEGLPYQGKALAVTACHRLPSYPTSMYYFLQISGPNRFHTRLDPAHLQIAPSYRLLLARASTGRGRHYPRLRVLLPTRISATSREILGPAFLYCPKLSRKTPSLGHCSFLLELIRFSGSTQ